MIYLYIYYVALDIVTGALELDDILTNCQYLILIPLASSGLTGLTV